MSDESPWMTFPAIAHLEKTLRPDIRVFEWGSGLDKVENAGGKILVPKTQISEDFGYMAVIIDSEGNRIAFHSIPQG